MNNMKFVYIFISILLVIATLTICYFPYAKEDISVDWDPIDNPNVNVHSFEVNIIYSYAITQKDSGEYIIIYSVKNVGFNIIMSNDTINWSEPIIILNNSNVTVDSFIDHFIVVSLSNGSLLFYFEEYDNKVDWISFSDNGINWSKPQIIELDIYPQNMDCQFSYINELSDGYLYALDPHRISNTYIYSSLDGINWRLLSYTEGYYKTIALNSDNEYIATGAIIGAYEYSYSFFSIDGENWTRGDRIPLYIHSNLLPSNEGLYAIGSYEDIRTTNGMDTRPITIIYSEDGEKWSRPNVLSIRLLSDNSFINKDQELILSFKTSNYESSTRVYKIIIITMDLDDVIISYT